MSLAILINGRSLRVFINLEKIYLVTYTNKRSPTGNIETLKIGQIYRSHDGRRKSKGVGGLLDIDAD